MHTHTHTHTHTHAPLQTLTTNHVSCPWSHWSRTRIIRHTHTHTHTHTPRHYILQQLIMSPFHFKPLEPLVHAAVRRKNFEFSLRLACIEGFPDSSVGLGFPGDSAGKESACNAGDMGSIPGLGGSPGEGHGTLLQYSCLENPMDRGVWWVTVHGVVKSWTRLCDFSWGVFLPLQSF